ncbi:MAG: MFS transporter [Pseudomonadota bacterium]
MAFFSTQHSRSVLALAVVICAYVLSFFQRFAPVGIAQDLAVAFQTTASSLGVLAATYFYVYTLMQIPTGILVDTLGPRRVLFCGGLVAAAGSCLFGLAFNLELALVGRALIGLGVSVVFIAMLKMIALYFNEARFASLVGLSMLIGNFGSVLAGVPLSWLAQTVGWRSVFVSAGGLSLFLAIVAWFLIQDRATQSSSALGSQDRKPVLDRTLIFSGLLTVLKNRDTWPAFIVNFGLSGSFFAFAGLWASPFLIQVHGMSQHLATSHVSLYFAGFALGCVLIGTLSDRMRKRKPALLVGSHLYALLWLVWLSGLTMPVSLSYALFFLMGALTASFTLTWACTKEVNPPLLSGMSTSVTNMAGFLAGAIFQVLVGWVMDWHWSQRGEGILSANGTRFYSAEDFQLGFFLLAGLASLGALATWRIRETGCRNVWQAP